MCVCVCVCVCCVCVSVNMYKYPGSWPWIAGAAEDGAEDEDAPLALGEWTWFSDGIELNHLRWSWMVWQWFGISCKGTRAQGASGSSSVISSMTGPCRQFQIFQVAKWSCWLFYCLGNVQEDHLVRISCGLSNIWRWGLPICICRAGSLRRTNEKYHLKQPLEFLLAHASTCEHGAAVPFSLSGMEKFIGLSSTRCISISQVNLLKKATQCETLRACVPRRLRSQKAFIALGDSSRER